MGVENLLIGIGIAVAQLTIGLFLAMGSVYLGIRMFDKLTEGIDEMKELQRGNVAVAILLGAIILSIANVVEGGVYGLAQSIVPGLTAMELSAALLIGVVNLIVGVVLAILSIYVAIIMLDKITVGIDEFKELKRGNVAVAIMMAAVLFAVSFVIRGAVGSMASALSPQGVAMSLGWA
ncbi:MAG: DUF350 domain-containing protein [Candidatus Micrarchaeota archaeon]|nr:DUF350 domain-containing protein [Candidatus Micrarchaeota archaeon]